MKYAAIQQRMATHPGSVVELARMPSGYTVLSDIKFWLKRELNDWIAHILAGQRGQLHESQIFQICEIAGANGHPSRATSHYEHGVHPTAVLQYTKLEKLYGEHMALEAWGDGGTSPKSDWKGLPLARTTNIYSAYSASLFHHLRAMHTDLPEMLQLINAVAAMERYGPVHVSSFWTKWAN